MLLFPHQGGKTSGGCSIFFSPQKIQEKHKGKKKKFGLFCSLDVGKPY
jgi:hypothetical protein